jgi:hypothetical protein
VSTQFIFVRNAFLTAQTSLKFNSVFSSHFYSRVDIATGYRLDGRGIRIRFPVGANFLPSQSHPNRFWGPPSLLSNGYCGLFLWGAKQPVREADHSLPSSAEVKNMWIYDKLISLWLFNENNKLRD